MTAATTPSPSKPQPASRLEAAKAIGGLIDAEAAEAERRRTLTTKTVEAMGEAGLFAVALPREVGGDEADFTTQIAVWEEVSRADGSAGWCLMAGATASAFVAAYMEDEAVEEMFGARPWVVHGGQFAPRGMAEITEGGYRVSGQWSFGSGTGHAAYVTGGVMPSRDGNVLMREDGMPEMAVVCVPREQVELLDNWHVMGLQGTGSYDYKLDDVFVPQAYTFPLLTKEPRRGGAIFRMGVLPITAAGHAGFALGVGRRALDEIRELAKAKHRLGASNPVAEQATFQKEYARMEAALRAARLLVIDTFGEALRHAEAGDEVGNQERALLRTATVHATDVAADAAAFAYKAGGSDALRDGSALQRCFRDMHAGTQHLFVDHNIYIQTAQVLLGLAPPALVI